MGGGADARGWRPSPEVDSAAGLGRRRRGVPQHVRRLRHRLQLRRLLRLDGRGLRHRQGRDGADVLDHHGVVLRARAWCRARPPTASGRGPCCSSPPGCSASPSLATSRVQSIWVGYVTYGLGVGIAVACAYVPMVATVGAWFVRRRTTALGVAVAGIGVGTLVLAPLSERLIDAYGWRTAYVVLGIGGAGAARCWPASAPIARRSGSHQAPAPLRRGRARPRLRHPLRLLPPAVDVAVRAVRVHQVLRHRRGHRRRTGRDARRDHRCQQRHRAARPRRPRQPARRDPPDAAQLRDR